MSASDVINAAQAAWKVIEDGKPSAQLSSGSCNAVPHVDDWQGLTNPQGPNRLTWPLVQTNGFGWHVVAASIEVRWEHSARYKGGGAFITNCWLYVPDCTVLWSYNVNISFQAHNPSNAGSESAPKARLPVTLSGSISCPFWTVNKQLDLILYGDGNWEQV